MAIDDRAAVIRALIESIEGRMTGKELKATVGDYVRLVQLERELKAEEQKEVRLRWIEEQGTSSES